MCRKWLNKNIVTGRVLCGSAGGARVVSEGEILVMFVRTDVKDIARNNSESYKIA
jgi:ethanolamine utilization microcompartment shell protein EutL